MKNDLPRIHISPETIRKMIEIAQKFRNQLTRGEKILRKSLRGKKLDGIKFRRQQPIGYFVVDFYNSAYALTLIRNAIRLISERKKPIPFPFVGEGEGGG